MNKIIRTPKGTAHRTSYSWSNHSIRQEHPDPDKSLKCDLYPMKSINVIKSWLTSTNI